MTVLQVCAYGAEYAGNFIASLEALECALSEKGIHTIYAFIDRAADKDWCKKIQQRTKVYFLPEAKARILPQTYRLFRNIYRENNIDIVHSHFELYDIPATVMAPRQAKIFWHLHDPINLATQKFSRRLLSKTQYGLVGKKATLISVADEYRKAVVFLGFPENQTTTIINGLDLSRVTQIPADRAGIKYDFLTFGWDFYRKGDDIILSACNKLADEGYHFKLLLNGNHLTWPVLDDYLNGTSPEWLIKGNPVKDVNQLLHQTGVFVQASRRETFSYAVCEAAYAGLPVISTDIAGLEWAHVLPTVDFVPSENVDALYHVMKQYLDGKSFSADQIKTTQQIIETRYSAAHWTKQILSIYNI